MGIGSLFKETIKKTGRITGQKIRKAGRTIQSGATKAGGAIAGAATKAGGVIADAAAKAGEKVKKTLTKTFTSNLRQAKTLLSGIGAVNSQSIIEGEDGSLEFSDDDFVAFAHKEKDNVLDKMNKIGKLLATSLLTTTTTHKLVDFKDVYYSSNEALERFRGEIFKELHDGQKVGVSDGNGGIKQKDFNKICKLFEKDDVDGALDKLAGRVYDLVEDEKEVSKLKKKFISKLKKYFNDINKNLEAVQKLTGAKGGVGDAMAEECKSLSESEIRDNANAAAKSALGEEYGAVGTKLDRIQVGGGGAIHKYFKRSAKGCYVGLIVVMLLSVCGGVALPVLAIELSSLVIFFAVMGILTSPAMQKRRFIKKYKNDCNKIKQGYAQIFKSMNAAKRYILEELQDQGSAKKRNVEFTVDCGVKAEKFVEELNGIWKKYADVKERDYGHFEKQEEIAKLQRLNKGIDSYVENASALVERLKEFDQNAFYKDLAEGDFSDADKKSISDYFNEKKLIKNEWSIGRMIEALNLIITERKDRKESNEKAIKELQTSKSDKEYEQSFKSMGKFKSGFAKTLANCKYSYDTGLTRLFSSES